MNKQMIIKSLLLRPSSTQCFCLRLKTTRPTEEWTDQRRFAAAIDKDQYPEIETPFEFNPKWMDIRFKTKNLAEKKVHSMAVDETLRSDARDARRISDEKLKALEDSLMSRS